MLLSYFEKLETGGGKKGMAGEYKMYRAVPGKYWKKSRLRLGTGEVI